MQSIMSLVNHYGYIILFSALVLELIAFPLPGELLMTYCGFLVYESKMNWIISILIASTGTILGITAAYFAGTKLGNRFFKKYGSYIHLGPERIEKTSKWFDSYGNKLLILAYFIPGVRHITGYFSGITEISYKKFAKNAYFGALLWTSIFISLGNVLGPNWHKFHGYIRRYLIIGSIIIALILLIIYSYKNHRSQIADFIFKVINNAISTYHSMGRIKIAMTAIAAVFLGLFALLIGLIQDFLAHEFDQFDIVVSYLVKAIFNNEWLHFMSYFQGITSLKVLLPLTLLLSIWIIRKNNNKGLEIEFLLIIICGGEALQYLLSHIFRRIGPNLSGTLANGPYTFPSNYSLMAITAYGFFSYIIIRHSRKTWIRPILICLTLFICIVAGLNPLYFKTEYPSDVYAGYIFGGVWLTLNIILLEINRILPKIQNKI